jgi:hypothetical protein
MLVLSLLVLVFGVGFLLGSLRQRAKLRLYKFFIEERLGGLSASGLLRLPLKAPKRAGLVP